jgi:hypothetical protein
VAELTPIPAAQRPAEPGYQPLSGYAVAAVIVAGVFALALVVLVGIGLWSRRTPLSLELLLVPVTGFVLSIIARSHIRNAEGTRTGIGLANVSWWVCVLGGAGFAAFLAANDFALRRESQRQADAFFEALRAGNVEAAFDKYVLPPELRGRADVGTPEFEQVYAPVGYPAYKNHPVIYAFRENGSAVQVEHVGAWDVGQEGDGFKATHKYRITLPEGVFTVQVKMVASEPRGGGRPQWHVEIGRSLGITSPSPAEWDYFSQFGRLEMESQKEGELFGREWMGHFSAGRLGQAYLYTRPLAERERGSAQLAAAAVLAGGSLLAGPVGADGQPIGAPGLPRPTLDALLKAGLFRRDAAGAPLPDTKIQELRESWATVTISPVVNGRRQMMGLPEATERTTFTLTPTDVTLAIPADLVYGTANRKLAPATVGIVCSDPDLVQLLTAARARGAADRDEGSATLKTLPPRDWRVAWVQTTLEQPANPMATSSSRPGPGGPAGGPGGPPPGR